MSFAAHWLALRADADRAARNADLAAEVAVALEACDPLRVLDLGAGTGATLRAIGPILPAHQTWRLADNDAALLAMAEAEAADGVTLETRVADFADPAALAALFDPRPDLVTASAFFDLAGAAWIDSLAALTSDAGAAFYAALTYDGRHDWQPPHPLDDAVKAAFDADQRRDKGLGPALGPDAAAYLAEAFRRRDYRVETGRSDWRLAQPDDAALIAELTRGTADALAPVLGTDAAADWHRARAAAYSVLVGHTDVLALPPGTA